MRFVIQVSKKAKVEVDGKVCGQIGQGLTILIGVGKDDSREIADKMIAKTLSMRIFKDDQDKTNLSIKDVNGELLLISQFTLYADCRKGNRPSFTNAAGAEKANELYEYIISEMRKEIPVVETGIFGEHMEVTLTNDGPFTIVLDSSELNI